MQAKSRNRHTVTALVLWIATLILTSTAIGQTAERYITLDFNRALAHVFDATTNTEVATIKVGNGPNSIVISPNGRIAFVSNFDSNYLSVIDLTIAAEIKRIPNVFVSQLGISADGATVVGTDGNDDGITVIDANTLSVVRTISFNGRLGDDPNLNGDAFASNPVVVGNKVYLETEFDFGVIDLGTGTVTDLGSNPASNFLTLASDVSTATTDGKFVIISREGALVIIDTTTNAVVGTIAVDLAFAVSASRDASNPGKIYGYMLRLVGATNHFSIVDLSAGSPTFGIIIGDLPLPAAFPFDLMAHVAPNADGTRALLTAHSVNPNVYIVDTSNAAAPALVGSGISVGTAIRDVDSGITQNQPPATAPVVASVSAPLVVNSATTALQISGSGFASDAQVRIGHLDPHAAQFISTSLLQVSVPADAPGQDASIIVTNPDLSQGVAGADQSGILRNAFVIASGPAFQPINEVAIVNAGDATFSVLNASTNATPNPVFPAPDRIVAIAITPDGSRAYVERTFAPATVDVFNFITNSFEASVPLNASPVGQPSQTRGIVIAPRFSTGKPAAYVASSVRIAPGHFSLNLYVIDADPASASFNTVVATLPTGEPHASSGSGGIAVTPDGHFAFVSGFEADGTGDLVILDLTSGGSTIIPMATLGVSFFQFALELSPDGNFLVLLADDGSAHIFDVHNPATPVLVTVIHGTPPAGFGPLLVNARIVGSTLYAFDELQNVVAIFNFNPAANNFSQLATFALPAIPTFFAVIHDVTPDGKLMYVPLREQDAVAVVDTAKVLAGDPSALLTEIGTGISPHLAAVRPATAMLATTIRYTGETTQNYHDVANLSATLVVQGTSVPIPGQTITFTLGTQSCASTTGTTGVAACGIVLNQVPGSYTVNASFAGSGNNKASSDSTGFTITREETATTYTGPTVIANGANTTFSAILKEDGAVAIAGRAITITLGSGSTAQTCNGTTDATGTVSCSILVNQPLGPGTVAAGFAGDALYLPSSSDAATILFAFPAQGAFVLGDQTASGAVEFWGDDWATVNMLTGGPAPDAFKGFAANTSEPPACGGAWTSMPGNSSSPPNPPLPSFMGVVVSTKVSKSGSTISGDTSEIVVVTPNAGYEPNPGHPGTGTVVATFCKTGGPTSGSMAGSWDFTAISGSIPHPVAVEAILTQDSSGNISGTGMVTTSGPAGNVFQADLNGSSLSNVFDMAVDFLGDTCSPDNGIRSLTGTINSSNQVTLIFDVGGSFTVTINGTLNPSALPSFSGSGTVSGPACASNGQTSPITGVMASSLAGSYSGVSASDSTEIITLNLTEDSKGNIAGNGADSTNGSFTIIGSAVADAFSATLMFPSSNNVSVLGYYDPQLGLKGSILLTRFEGAGTSICSDGLPSHNGSCLIGILARQ